MPLVVFAVAAGLVFVIVCWMIVAARMNANAPDEAESLLMQAVETINQHLSEADQRRLAQRADDVVKGIKYAGSANTPLHLQVLAILLAQSIGLAVWEEFGGKLGRKECIDVAQASTLIDLRQIARTLRPDGVFHAMLMQMIREQALARQASTPVVLCFMGSEGKAREMLADVRAAWASQSDLKMITALASISRKA